MMRRLRGIAVLGVVGLALGLLAACGDDEDPAGSSSPSSSPTSSTTQPAGGTETSPATPTSTEVTPPAVTPATGLELVEKTSAVRAPAGWEEDEPLVDYASSASDPETLSSVQLVDNVSLTGDEVSLDEMAKYVQQSLADNAKVTRLPDVDLAGTPAFRLQYTIPGDPLTHVMISTQRQGRSVGLDFLLARGTIKSQPELVESVLASFRWR